MSSDPSLLLSPARPPDSQNQFFISSSSRQRPLSLPSFPLALQESSSLLLQQHHQQQQQQSPPYTVESFPTPKGIILSDASLAEKRRSLETGKRAKKRVSFQAVGLSLPSPSPSPSPSLSPTSPLPKSPTRNRDTSLKRQQLAGKLDDVYLDLYHHFRQFSDLPSHSLSSLPGNHLEPALNKMLQVLEDQSSPVGDLEHQLDDIQSMLTTLHDQQTSAEELEGLSSNDIDHILGALPQSSGIRPRSLTLPSHAALIDANDTPTFIPSHGRSQSVTASPATYLPSSTSDFPSPPSTPTIPLTPPIEETESNARYDRIVSLLNGLIGEGKEALESEGADILQRKTSHANMRRHSRGNSISEAAAAARPQSRGSRGSGRSSRLSMRSEGDSHNGPSNSSDEGESNNNNNNIKKKKDNSSSSSSSSLRRASVELDAESELSDYSDDGAVSPGHSRDSSMSDTEAKTRVEAFRRSLHELDRIDVVSSSDVDENYNDEGVEEEDDDHMAQSPTHRLPQPFSSVSQLPDDASPSHNVESSDEWDEDDPPLSAYMNSPSRNNGHTSADLSAENPLLQSIKRVDTNLRRIERLSLELFHDDDDELYYGEDDFDDGAHEGEMDVADRFVEDADAIAVRDKTLSSMRWALRRNLARFIFEGLLFVFAYLVCSPLLIGIAHDRVLVTFGLIMAIINQLNHHSRVVWAKDSTELPGWYPVRTIGQLVKKSFRWNNEGERPGLYNSLAMHAPADKGSFTKSRHPAKPSMPSYAKTHLSSKSPSGSPHHTLQRALPQSSLRNSFLPDTDVQHHHHHFTCDHCLQTLEVVADHAGLDHGRVGDSMFEGDSVVRLARYEQMPGRRSRRMSV